MLVSFHDIEPTTVHVLASVVVNALTDAFPAALAGAAMMPAARRPATGSCEQRPPELVPHHEPSPYSQDTAASSYQGAVPGLLVQRPDCSAEAEGPNVPATSTPDGLTKDRTFRDETPRLRWSDAHHRQALGGDPLDANEWREG